MPDINMHYIPPCLKFAASSHLLLGRLLEHDVPQDAKGDVDDFDVGLGHETHEFERQPLIDEFL